MFISDEQKSRLQVAASRVITAKATVSAEKQSLEYVERRLDIAATELRAADKHYDAVCAELVDPSIK